MASVRVVLRLIAAVLPAGVSAARPAGEIPYSTWMLGERLIKRMKHLSKWGRRQGISCFRLYERDIPDHPIVIDWFADEDAEHIAHSGDAVAWFHQRTRDETPEETAAYQRSACEEICTSLGLAPDRLFVKQRARQRDEQGGRAQYEKLDTRRICKTVCEQGARFEINLSDYLDVGLFLDHRPNRLALQKRARGKRVLNLFAYTGSFSVQAMLGGAARTTTVDLSRTYLDWYRRNLELNGLALDDAHQAVHADCMQWLEEGPANTDPYDIVICDPPTFSNSKRMKTDFFSIERDHAYLLGQVARYVAPGGEIFFSTNARGFDLTSGITPAGFGVQEITHRSVPEDFRNRTIHRCWRLAEGWTPRRTPQGAP